MDINYRRQGLQCLRYDDLFGNLLTFRPLGASCFHCGHSQQHLRQEAAPIPFRSSIARHSPN